MGKILVSDSGVEFKKAKDVPIGTVFSQRVVSEVILKGKLWFFKLHCPDCNRDSTVRVDRVKDGMVCVCKASEKRKVTYQALYGVDNPGQIEEVKLKIKEARDNKSEEEKADIAKRRLETFERTKANHKVTKVSDISRDFKIGDKRCGGTIIEIHEEVGNNYAVVKCDYCGCETKSIYNRLSRNLACECQKTVGMVAKAKERRNLMRVSVKVGQVIKGLRVLEITTNKHGKTSVVVTPKRCKDASVRSEMPLTSLLRKRRSYKSKKPIENVKTFLSENEWVVLSQWVPARKVTDLKGDKCDLCGGNSELQAAHKIPFIKGIKEWGLNPGFLNHPSNIATACRVLCNKACELSDRGIAEDLIKRGVCSLPLYLSSSIQELFESVKIEISE